MKRIFGIKSKGFTLVEVIVVAVIVAILAAVAIPIYTGYINDSAQNMVTNEAANFSSAVSMGINAGATGVTSDGNTPPTYTWTFPAGSTELAAAPPTYKVPDGVTITAVTEAKMIVAGNTATLTFKGKTATASW